MTNIPSDLAPSAQHAVYELREQYPDVNAFMDTYNPSRQLEICYSPETCVLGDSPTLRMLNWAYGKHAAEMWLTVEITEISLTLGLKEAADKRQVKFCAATIACEFSYLKVDELLLFFFRFKGGCYELFYSRFDPQALLRSLRGRFLAERNHIFDLDAQKTLDKQLEETKRWRENAQSTSKHNDQKDSQ